jgi:hypothetical protein
MEDEDNGHGKKAGNEEVVSIFIRVTDMSHEAAEDLATRHRTRTIGRRGYSLSRRGEEAPT